MINIWNKIKQTRSKMQIQETQAMIREITEKPQTKMHFIIN